MREILHKGLTKSDQVWVQGQLLIDHHPDNSVFDTYCIAISPDLFQVNANSHKVIGGTYVEVIPESIGQYAYRKDKDGIKIFEGDVVKVLSQDTSVEVQGSVVWNDSSLQFAIYNETNKEYIPLCDLDESQIKIIGTKQI